MKRLLSCMAAIAAAAAAAIVPLACTSSSAQIVVGGNGQAGRTAITHYGCGSCHTIPGVKGATALVGPPLIHWSRRGFIAGKLANTPDNLQQWIRDPQSVWPGNDMPNLGVSAADARNIAAYLDGLS